MMLTVTRTSDTILATRLRLHQEIMKDKFASRKTPHITAFGRRLPPEMQLKPPNKKEFKNWLHCNVPERLQSMAEVWQGITHLKYVFV
ncbi:hypothetical protein NQ318_010986 [Aromia moschata]|uniref:Uncharacterized protein n=1 Tax=Aromia moschata TaxID=1265417 RepID=A0AAV8YNL3_9CUCU|nr:hypothetical protein NQ318_010986 [Aromia moschata]